MSDRKITRAVFFDFGGTLDADGIPWKEHFQAIYESEGVREKQKIFDRAFYDADDSLTEEGLERLSLKETLLEQVGRVLRGLGKMDFKLQERIADAFYTDTKRMLEKNTPVLGELKTRYRLGIISNFYGNLPSICEELGLSLLLDVVVDSRQFGHLKPGARIFNHALQALEVEAGEAVMVGDSFKRDMLGAKALGIPHVLLHAPGKKEIPETCCAGDRVIRTLSEILEHY